MSIFSLNKGHTEQPDLRQKNDTKKYFYSIFNWKQTDRLTNTRTTGPGLLRGLCLIPDETDYAREIQIQGVESQVIASYCVDSQRRSWIFRVQDANS